MKKDTPINIEALQEDGDVGFIYVRSLNDNLVGLTLSLKKGGDIEVYLDSKDVNKLIDVLKQFK